MVDGSVCEPGVYQFNGVRIMDRAGRKRLPIGDDGFETVAPRAVFVDKSLFIADVLDSDYKVTLFCRPRRFGKTLNMTMLKAFLELPPDGVSRAPLFEGLDIWDIDDGSYRAEQGVRPTVFFTFNDVKKLDWQSAYESLGGKIAAEYRRHAYLLEDDTLDASERAQFERITSKQATLDDLASSLRQLTLYLKRRFGRNVVVLIDEYDAPIMAGHTNGYYREVVDFIKGWLTGAFKDGGTSLDFACLTGVQRITKESVFSDLNNMTVDTPLNRCYDERFGFTDKEVRALASYLHCPDKHDELREWYDGYRFGSIDVYNPWSVLNYFAHDCEAGVYWANTASNTVVGDAVRATDDESLEEVFSLLKPGGVVYRPLDMDIVFPESGLSGDALWSMLYLAGYLTTDDVADPTDKFYLRPLRVPNREISQVFHGEVIERFRQVAGGTGRLQGLHTALVSGDSVRLRAELARILAESPSCRDLVSENSYHMLMTGLFFGVPGYADPLSNREGGKGYFDLRLVPNGRRSPFGSAESLPVITVEFKFMGKQGDPSPSGNLKNRLYALAEEGLRQISSRSYDQDSATSFRLRYGIAFCGKDVSVACEKILGKDDAISSIIERGRADFAASRVCETTDEAFTEVDCNNRPGE